MAPFLSRLFSLSNKRKHSPEANSNRIYQPKFNSAEQIRVMLFRERFGQERRLLFDTRAVRKKDGCSSDSNLIQNKILSQSSLEKSFKLNNLPEKDIIYEWQKQSQDEQMLREMIFGSVSTSYQGTTIKVHTIRCPLQIMISIVYPAPSVSEFRMREDLEESGNSNSSTYEMISKNSGTEQIHLAHSVPVNVPSRSFDLMEEKNGSYQSLDGYTSLPAYLNPENNSSSLPRSGSYNSLQRRLLRNKATSMQFGPQKLADDALNDEFSRVPSETRIKLGLSIVISLCESEERQFQDFLFTHIALIESHMLKLRGTVNEAYLHRRKFVQLMLEGSRELQCSIQDLYTAPRLEFPEWLSIISSSNHSELSHMFMHKLIHVVREFDTKETNFVVSTLLTAILTHHLAWVSTVIPTDAKICPSQRSHKHVPLWVNILSKSRPYNPLWVQLGDLYGAVCKPSKITKVVVKGCKREIIILFLQVVSYFIRCSDICEPVAEREGAVLTDKEFFPRTYPSAENSSPRHHKSFGWSLMAGVSDHFLKDFCLQGVHGTVTEEEVKEDLNLMQVHALGDPVSEAVCIVLDIDAWTVHLQSSNWSERDICGSAGLRVGMSSLVSSMCESVLHVHDLGLPPDSCIIYLEDRLQELYCYSVSLSEYVRCNQNPLSLEKVASALNMDASDMPLLLAIATTHSPHLAVFKL